MDGVMNSLMKTFQAPIPMILACFMAGLPLMSPIFQAPVP